MNSSHGTLGKHRKAQIGREQAPPVPSNTLSEQAMPVPYNIKYQNLHGFQER